MGTLSRLQLYPLLRIAIAFVAGITLGSLLWQTVPPVAWMAAEVCLFISAFLLHGSWQKGLSILLLTLCIGASLFQLHRVKLHTSFPDKEVGYSGVLLSQPADRGRVVQFTMWVTSCSAPIKLHVSLLKDTATCRYRQLGVGDGIAVVSQLHTVAPDKHTHHFNRQRWLHSQSICAETFVFYNHWKKTPVDYGNLPLFQRARLKALQVRANLVNRLSSSLTDSSVLPVIAAVTLGDKHALPKELRQSYSEAGASHVLALSGLHLGILYSFLLLLFPQRKGSLLRQALSLLLVWCFAMLVGLSPSICRAAVMISICVVCEMLSRSSISINTLSMAAIALLAVNPLSLWDVGFQLSFLSVLSILLLASPLQKLIPTSWQCTLPPLKWTWSLLSVSLAAQLGAMPLVAYYFGTVSLCFFITNLLIVPLTYCLLLLTLLFFLSTPVEWLLGPIAWLMEKTAWLMNRCVLMVANLPGSSLTGVSLSAAQLFLIYVAMVCIALIIFRMHQAAQKAHWSK